LAHIVKLFDIIDLEVKELSLLLTQDLSSRPTYHNKAEEVRQCRVVLLKTELPKRKKKADVKAVCEESNKPSFSV
jgi:hypothetical protein